VFDFAVSVFGTLLQRIRGLNFGRAGSGKLKSETETAKKKESSQRTRKSKSKIFVLPRPLQVNSADCGTKKERLLCGDKISSIAGQLPTANFPIPNLRPPASFFLLASSIKVGWQLQCASSASLGCHF